MGVRFGELEDLLNGYLLLAAGFRLLIVNYLPCDVVAVSNQAKP